MTGQQSIIKESTIDISERQFWNKKTIVSYFLSVLVFFIHISTFSNYINTGDTISILNQVVEFVIKQLFTPIAVPLFFIISGFTFFRNYTNEQYDSKLRKRIKTLLVPYLLWNTIWTVFEILLSYSPLKQFFVGRELFTVSVKNIFLSIFFHTTNGPFWFIFDLMCFVIIAPIIFFLMRNKYFGLIAIAAIYVLRCFHIELPQEIFFRSDSIIYYMVGAYFAMHMKDFFVKAKKKQSLLWAIVLIICIILNTLYCYNLITIPDYIYAGYLIVFSLSLWKTVDLFVYRIECKPFYSRSFLVFAMHINVSAVITKLLYLLLPKPNYFAIPNAFLTIVATLLFINGFSVLLIKKAPKVYGLLSGER